MKTLLLSLTVASFTLAPAVASTLTANFYFIGTSKLGTGEGANDNTLREYVISGWFDTSSVLDAGGYYRVVLSESTVGISGRGTYSILSPIALEVYPASARLESNGFVPIRASDINLAGYALNSVSPQQEGLGAFDEDGSVLVMQDTNFYPFTVTGVDGGVTFQVSGSEEMAPVPEPASAILLGAAVCVLGYRRYRAA